MALTDLAHRRERRGEVEPARALLEEALAHDPTNGAALVVLGDLRYFHDNDFARAIQCWERAHLSLSSPEWARVAPRVAQAKRDQRMEREFAVVRTPHFQIRYPGPETREAVVALGQRLEHERRRLTEVLGASASDITVIIYPRGDLQRATTQRDWTIGFYDGRLRLRLEDLGTAQESWLVAHELAHAFLHHLYGLRIPVWVHEGYAQMREGDRPATPAEAAARSQITSRAGWIPLKWLDARFERPADAEDLARAYAQARVVVEFLVTRYGMPRMSDFLQRVAQGAPVEQAFDEVFAPSRWARVAQGILE